MSHYDTLGIGPNASQSEIEAAFEKLARSYNSGQNPDPARAAQSAKAVAEAYRVLHDPKRRREYDEYLAWLESPPDTAAISDEEFRSWLETGKTIEGGLAAKKETGTIRSEELLARVEANRRGRIKVALLFLVAAS
jgi:curved DNA-binding protein CbpA